MSGGTNRKQRGLLRRVDSAVSRGRRADGGSKLSVDKNRLRHQLFYGTLAQLPSVQEEEELARGMKYSNKISREHSRGGMSVCI